MTKTDNLLALDVGSKRIGVARADSGVKIATPVATISVDGTEVDQLSELIREYQPVVIVVGYPRNQAGEPTAQTAAVEKFAQAVSGLGVKIDFQDESLTSVIAEERLGGAKNNSFDKSAVDAEAAAIILQDYLEEHYGY